MYLCTHLCTCRAYNENRNSERPYLRQWQYRFWRGYINNPSESVGDNFANGIQAFSKLFKSEDMDGKNLISKFLAVDDSDCSDLLPQQTQSWKHGN